MTSEFQTRIGYHFSGVHLLERALMHPSLSSPEQGNELDNYERLEFLGDAVLDLVMTEMLIKRYPDEPEGALAKRRSFLVCGKTLSDVGTDIGIGEHLVMSEGEEKSGGRENATNLENATEALVAAIYLDGGLEVVRKAILTWWEPYIDEMKEPPKDPKTALQEWVQSHKYPLPVYTVLNSEGPAHAPTFTIELKIEGCQPVTASASSKRSAQREAAHRMLEQIEAMENHT